MGFACGNNSKFGFKIKTNNSPKHIIMNTLQVQKFINLAGYNVLSEDGVFGSKTKLAKLQIEKSISADLKKNHEISCYTGFFAYRTKEIFDNLATDFLLFFKNGIITECAPCSTRAGDFYVFSPITYGGITGTAVLAEGYYPKTYLGSFQTRLGWRSFECLQRKSINIYRDGNRNRVIDKTTLVVGGTDIGINIHSAGWGNIIGRWSAGCIVVPREHWDIFASENLQEGIYYDLVLV